MKSIQTAVVFTFLLAPLMPAHSQVQTNAPQATITLEECVQSAVERNLNVQLSRHAPNIARYDIKRAYGAQYDPVFSAEANRSHLDAPSSFDPKKSGFDYPYTENIDTLSAGFSGRGTPGLSYSMEVVSIKNSAVTDFSLAKPPSPLRYTNDWDAMADIQLRQALLRDFWTDSNRVQISIAKKDLKISEQVVRLQLMSTVLEVELAYYDLIYASENVKVRQSALDLANELLTDDRRRIAASAMVPLDEKLAESKVESAKADLLAAQELLGAKRNELLSLITDHYETSKQRDLNPSDRLLVIPERFDRNECLRKALTTRPEIVEAKLRVEKQGIIIRYDRNQMFPVLDLVGSLGTVGSDDSRTGSLDGMTEGDHSVYSAGVIFKMPLSNMAARNRYRASKEKNEEALLQLRIIEQDILVQIDNSLNSVDKSFQRIEATRRAREYSEAALDAERKKLASAATTSFIVSEYERNLVKARTDEILAVVAYNKAQAQMAFNQGLSLEKYQVKLDVK